MTVSIALAFESGGDAGTCTAMVATLREMHVRATIFLDGRWVEQHSALVKTMANDGHEFGNHAYSHPDLTTLSDAQVVDELEHTEALAVRLTGRSTRPWFRPPFQRLDDRVRQIATQQGYRCLSRDALDGAHYLGPSTPEAIAARSLARGREGSVLTYHLRSRNTLAVLPEIVESLQAHGAALGAISDLPFPPSERAPLHPDFVGLDVDPGYLRMHRAIDPPQMVNLLTCGADELAPVDEPLQIGEGSQGLVTLFIFNGRTAAELPRASTAHHVACLAGDAFILVQDSEGTQLSTVYVRVGDTVALRRDWRATALPAPHARRAILLFVQ